MSTLSVETPIGSEVARITKTAAVASPSIRRGGTQIHTDEYARQMGFKGALVQGLVLLGYMTEMLVQAFGEAWFEKGRVKVRFRRPIYSGEEVVIRAQLKEKRTEQERVVLVLDLSVESQEDGRVAVVGEASCLMGDS